MSAHPKAKIAIIGQAPGTRVHASGIPWDDPSGKQLRKWMAVSNEDFYNPEIFAIIPMGFCYPGKGKSGDLPPRSECAPQWHEQLFEKMPNLKLTLLIGQYAQRYYLKDYKYTNLTNAVSDFELFEPYQFPMPHPSPRNRFWLKNNPWFEKVLVTKLQNNIHKILNDI